jgi:sarcosine oxidase
VTRDYDVAVLGLGGIGSGAAYWLAKRGARVLGLEQFEFGHDRGESHDHSRIIRLSYVTPAYVRLAKEAYEAWEALERDTGERLVFQTGGLDIGPNGGAIPLEGYADAMTACGVPFEWLDAAEIRKRWPVFAVGDNVRALFQSQSGIVAAARATAAHQRAARAGGATLLSNAQVNAIRIRDGEIVLDVASDRYRAGKLVVTAGPWSAPVLAQFGVRFPLEITKEQVTYFRPRELAPFAFGRFPIWIWMDDPSFYGFPIFGEEGAVKVTQDAGGKPVEAGTRGFEEDREITERVRAFLREHLPAAAGPLQLVKTCLYTLTPDRDFVVDTLPGYPDVSIAIGAGHAFKFASVIGRILSQLALDGSTRSDISAFAADRAILRLESPPKTYMV